MIRKGVNVGWNLVKQPDGRYAIWTTVADGFILRDADAPTIRAFWIEHEAKRIAENFDRMFKVVERDGRMFGGLSWEQCVHWHGADPDG